MQRSTESLQNIMYEITLLNRKYGNKITSLTRKQLFICPRCRYQEVFTPHEKILRNKACFEPVEILEIQPYSIPQLINIYWMVFETRCECPKNHSIYSWMTPLHVLSILRQERDFVEKGIKRPYEAYCR